MSGAPPVTKEMLTFGAALALGALLLGGGDGQPKAAGRPLPRVPDPEPPAAVAAAQVPVLAPRLLDAAPAAEGRNPFAATSVWERPVPDPLAPPPERPRGRLAPLLLLAGGRAQAPLAPRFDLAAIRAQAEGVDLASLGEEDAGAPPGGAPPGPDPGAPLGPDEPGSALARGDGALGASTAYEGIELRRYDLLYLKGVAEAVEGTLAEESRDAYIFRKRGSASAIPYDKSLVERIDRAPRPESVHLAESKRLAASDVAGRLNLARFCLAHQLYRQAREEALAAARHAGPDPAAYRLAAAAARAEYAGVTEAYHGDVRDRELKVYELAEAAGALAPDLRLARARLFREEGVREAALAEVEAALAALEQAGGGPGGGGGSEGGEAGEASGDPAPAGADASGLALDVRLELGDLALGLGRPAEAARAYEAAAADGGPVRALYGLALARFSEGAVDDAIAALDRVIEDAPALASARVARGQLALYAGFAVPALGHFDEARKLGDRGIERLAWQGLALALLGERERGEALVRSALALHASPDLELVLGYLAELADRADEAAAIYRAVEDRGGRSSALAALLQAELWLARGALGEAEAALIRAARRGYDFAETSRGIAAIRRRTGDAAKAVRFARYAETARPDDGALAYEVGLCYLALGNEAEAERAFARAAERLPGDPYPVAALGRILFARGEHAAAEERFREALARAPGHAYAAHAVERLELARRRRVWRDDFERADGPSLHNRWKEEEANGVEVSVRGGRLAFTGVQQNRDQAPTEAVREDDKEVVAAFRAQLRVGQQGARAGLAIRTRDGEARLFRDADGALRYQLRAGNRPPEAAVDLGAFGATAGARELEIAVGGRERGEVIFYLDRREVGRARTTAFARRSPFACALWVEAALGTPVDIGCDEAAVFIEAR